MTLPVDSSIGDAARRGQEAEVRLRGAKGPERSAADRDSPVDDRAAPVAGPDLEPPAERFGPAGHVAQPQAGAGLLRHAPAVVGDPQHDLRPGDAVDPPPGT